MTDGGAALLASCHNRSLEAAAALGARTISFPATSCGVYGWDPTAAAPITVSAVRAFVTAQSGAYQRITFVLLNDVAHSAFVAAPKA